MRDGEGLICVNQITDTQDYSDVLFIIQSLVIGNIMYNAYLKTRRNDMESAAMIPQQYRYLYET